MQVENPVFVGSGYQTATNFGPFDEDTASASSSATLLLPSDQSGQAVTAMPGSAVPEEDGSNDVLTTPLLNCNTHLPTAGYLTTVFYTIDQFESSGADHMAAYRGNHSPPHPTIGIGFDLTDAGSLRAVLQQFGIQWQDPVRVQFQKAMTQTYNSDGDLDTALNSIMASWASGHSGARTTFAFTGESEVIDCYNSIINTYEGRVNAKVSGIPQSYERVALISLSYAGGLGPGLSAAVNAGDRAEAWWQIRYQTNGAHDPGAANRHYAEAQIFGLFYDKNVSDKAEVQDQEALLAFRMKNAHQTQMAQYDATYGSGFATANDKLDWIIGQVPGFDVEHVSSLSDMLAPALQKLIFDYADPSNIAPDLKNAIEYTAEQGLSFTITTPNAAWVAADVRSDAGNAHVVDRTGGATMNDLIFGSITVTSNDANQADTLRGGAGNDFIVGGSGADTIQGGNGNGDTVSYLGSPDAVHVDLAAGTGTGGYADGDTLAGVENVFGSNGDDTLVAPTGVGNVNIVYGAGANDTLTGGDKDLLVGGEGDDHIIVMGTVVNSASVVGGPGNDIIDATALSGPGADVYFTIGDGHDTVMGNPNDTFEDPGTGIVQFLFPNLTHGGAVFTWTDYHKLHTGEVYDVWRGDGHITLSDGSTIDIGVVYGHSDPFSDNHLTPVSAGDYLVFEDGDYSLAQIWSH